MSALTRTNFQVGGKPLRQFLAVSTLISLVLNPLGSYLPLVDAGVENEIPIPQLSLPFAGNFPITQQFGEETEVFESATASAELKTHNGIDFALPLGTEVLSVDPGTVEISGEGDFGITIAINHSWGRSVYGHLQSVSVSVGQQVERGELVGLSGNTGLSTDPHLHFGIKSTRSIAQKELFGFIDPSPYLPTLSDANSVVLTGEVVNPLAPAVDSVTSAQVNRVTESGEIRIEEESLQANDPLTVILEEDTGPVTAEVKTGEGETLATTAQVLQKDGRKVLEITPAEEIDTGSYEVTVESGGEIILEDDFSWGVLAINSDKSIYLPGETAKFQLAVLDDQGLMVCDANLKLKVNPSGLASQGKHKNEKLGLQDELTTENGEIRVTEECQIHEYTTRPDYETSYQVGGAGVYELELTAQTTNGTHTVTDSFEVRNKVAFEVTRESATRIFPIREYPTTFTIKFNQDFTGSIKEFVPTDFEILPLEGVTSWSGITQEKGKKVISWEVTAKKGDEMKLGYRFDATNNSPNLIPIGPLRFYQGGEMIFEETRQWQLAIDATRTWDGGCGVDTNWSCDANWSSDTEPGSADIAAFDNTSDNDSVVDATFAGSVQGVDINSGYDGTITLSRSLTVGSSGFDQADGTWNGGSQTFTIVDSNFVVSGGDHTATTGTWTLDRDFSHSGGNLTMTGATVVLDGDDQFDDPDINCSGTIGGEFSFAVNSGFSLITVGSGCEITVSSINMTGSLYNNGTVNHTGSTFTINAALNVEFNNNSGAEFNYSGTNITLESDFNQFGTFNLSGKTITFDGDSGNENPNIDCSGSLGGSVVLSAAADSSTTIESGCTVTVTSIDNVGDVNVNGTMNHTGSTFNIDSAVGGGDLHINSGAVVTYSGTNLSIEENLNFNGGTFDTTGKQITMDGSTANQTSQINCATSTTIPGTFVIDTEAGADFILDADCSITVSSFQTVGDTTINGTMNHTGSVFTMGKLAGFGDITFSSTSEVTYAGTSIVAEGDFIVNTPNFDLTGKTLTMEGTSTSGTLTCANGAVLGSVIIDKSFSTTVSLGGNCTLSGNLTRSDGALNNPSSARTLTVQGNLSISTSDTFGGANLTLTMGGSGTQTITQNAGTMSGVFKVDKSGGSVSLSTGFSTGTTCNLVEGTFNLNGKTFTCGSTFTVEDGGNLQLIGSDTSTTPTLNTGSTVTYKGDGDSVTDFYNLKDWGYKNLTIAPTDAGDTFGADNSLDNNLEAYYKMDNAGSIVDDDSGNDLDGTSTGTTSVAGTIDNARSFASASSQYISVPSSLPSFSSNGFSAAIWVNPTTSTSWARFFDFGQGQSDDNILLTRQSTGSDLIFEVYNGGSSGGQVEYASGITNGSWQHFVVTVDTSGSVVIYKNGSQVQTGTTAAPQNVTRTSNFIGRSNWASDAYYNGLIDETRIYSRTLSPQEVAAIHAGTTDNSITTLTVGGNFTHSSGGFNAPPTMNVAGNFAHSGGTFTHNSGTVNLNGSGQQLSGNTTFYNLTKNTSSTDTLTFAAGSAQTIENTMDLQGEAGNLLSLRSSSPGTQWDIDPQATRTIEFIDVQDSNNTNATQIATAGFNITNSGNNDGWTFGIVTQSPDSPGSLGPPELIDGSTTGDTTPTLSFVITDPDSDETDHYHHQNDDNPDFSSPTVDYTSVLGGQGPVTFTLGQSGTYTAAPSGNIMPNGEYYWRVKALDENGVDSAFVNASSEVAFVVAALTPTPTPTPTEEPVTEDSDEEIPVEEGENEEPSEEGGEEEATPSATTEEPEQTSEENSESPEGLLEDINDLVSKTVTTLAAAFPEAITAASEEFLEDLRESAAAPLVERTGQGVVVVTGLGVYAPVIVRELYTGSVLLTFKELPLLFIRYFLVLLEIFHIRKRSKPWGVVYDSITKQPIDPAIVYLSKPGAKDGDEEMKITDFTGRFGFLVGKGLHRLNVIKTDYVFPSKLLAGKEADGERQNLYFGEQLDFDNPDLVNVNIPMDQVTFNWNQAHKPIQYHPGLFIFKKVVFKAASIAMLVAALTAYVLEPTPLNLALILVYVGLTVIHKIFVRSKRWGVVHDSKTGKVLPLVRVQGLRTDGVSDGFCLTDHLGRYYLILDEGEHYLQVEKELENGEVKILKKVGPIKIKKNSTIINPDIQV